MRDSARSATAERVKRWRACRSWKRTARSRRWERLARCSAILCSASVMSSAAAEGVGAPGQRPRRRGADQGDDPRSAGLSGVSMDAAQTQIERPRMDVDIACVGFGPATAGFLTTLSKQLVNADGTPAVESAACPACRRRWSAMSAPMTSASASPGSSPAPAPCSRAFPTLKKPASPWPRPSARKKCFTCSIRWARAAVRPRCGSPMH